MKKVVALLAAAMSIVTVAGCGAAKKAAAVEPAKKAAGIETVKIEPEKNTAGIETMKTGPVKKVVIFGDSYSTFEGSIPEGYACWYFRESEMQNDCHCVDSTWWSRVVKDLGMSLLLNSSYSGATICNTGYNGDDYSDRSFVTRMKTDIVAEDGTVLCGDEPDVILILAGTNDSWAHAPAGGLLGREDWRQADLACVLPAVSYMMGYLTEKLPKTRILLIVNSELDPVTTGGLHEAARIFGAESLQLVDIDKQWNHPSNAGMRAIAEQVERILQ